MTQRTQNIIKEVDTLENQEFQEVVFSLLQKSKQRASLKLQTIEIQNGKLYILPYFYTNTTEDIVKPQSKFDYLELMNSWKGKLSSDIMIDEEEFYQ